jgi:hypothetical protein
MFNEKEKEFYKGTNIPVWQSPKYLESKSKAIEIIKSEKYNLKESDFWILMNTIQDCKKMAYNGLIISHNGCLKINDNLDPNLKFKPSCVSRSENGYNGSLIYEYCNDEQGLFEVGEVSQKTLKNDYAYAMAFKRCFDRVVLKNCKLAYAGIYSDSEADEFKEKQEQPITENYKFSKGDYKDLTIKDVFGKDKEYLINVYGSEKTPISVKREIEKIFIENGEVMVKEV